MEDAEWWAQQGSLEGCKWEEQEAKKAVDRASKFMKDEKYQRAISLIEKAERLSPGFKGLSELLAVAEVCLAATWDQCTCQARPQNKTPDWFRVLQVDEKADSNAIKKRYRQLALLLHPDKNKHVKAEQAFNLVSEAYACLSDKYKRSLFTLGRSKARCRRCVLTSRMQSPTPSFGYFNEHQQKVSAQQKPQAPATIAKANPSEWKSDAEKLQIFRERARARVSSLEQAWEARNAKRNLRERTKADRAGGFGDSFRDHRSDKTDSFSELRHQLDQMERESRQGMRDYYNWRTPSRPSQAPECKNGDRTFTNLKDVGRQKKMQKEKPNVSQSLDDLLNMLRAENSAYARRDLASSRGEPRSGTKEGCMSARSTEGTPVLNDDDYDSLNWSPGNRKADPADADLHPHSIDKLLTDLFRSVELASREELLDGEDMPTVAADQTCRGVDSLFKGESSGVHSPRVEGDSCASRSSLWGDRGPCGGGSAGCTDSSMAHRTDGNEQSRSYEQIFEENPVPFPEGNICTCKIPAVESEPVVTGPMFFEPVVFDPMCTVNQGDEIGDESMTRIGESRCRDSGQANDELPESESSRVGCGEALSSKPLSHAMRRQDMPSVVAETSNTNVCMSESQLYKVTAEDSANQAVPSSLPTASSTGGASVRCKSLKGGMLNRDGSVHVTSGSDDELRMRRLVAPACYSSLLNPTRAGDVVDLPSGVPEHRAVVIDKPSKSPVSLNHPALGPLTEAARGTEDVDAFLQNESTPGPDPLEATSGRGEGLQNPCLPTGEDRQPGKDAWSFLDLDREQTIMREHKEKSDQLLKTLERLREEAKSVAATLDNLRRSVGTDSDVMNNSFFVNSCHSSPQSLVAS